MTLPELPAIWLTLRLAFVTTLSLLIIGVPLAWWLATTRAKLKPVIETIVALPLVLPPTVIGFYILIALNPGSPFGSFWLNTTGTTLTFSFVGLVLASVLYSLPFMVQPLQTSFETAAKSPVELAATLGASPLDAFWNVAAPASARGFLTAIVLTFAHTLGEFGIVLMVGGNIPGRTRTVSIAIYEHVETLDYGAAHTLSLFLLCFSFVTLLCVYTFNRKARIHVG